jgi:hypothetical protein
MENNHSSTKHSAFDRSLSLPHFDEEATVLSARPVVPLHQVNAETGPRRRVLFGLSILAALLVGAISATLLMQPGQNAQVPTDAQVSPLGSSTGAAGGSTPDPVEAGVPLARQPDQAPQIRAELNARDSSSKNRVTVPIERSSRGSTTSRRSLEADRDVRDNEGADDFENDERQRRVERRDARREARRQYRRQQEQRDDGVLRIREIFEGTPRP